MYMITSDTNLDITCGAQFLGYRAPAEGHASGSYFWTTNPAHAYTFSDLKTAEDVERIARTGELPASTGMLQVHASLAAEPHAEVIPAMEQNADGEWSDGEWEHAAELEAAL